MNGYALETLITKSDADMIFSLTKDQWEEKAKQFGAPGWTAETGKVASGTLVQMSNSATGVRVTIQPLFISDNEPPKAVVVGNYFPVGFLPPITAEIKKGMEAAARKDLTPRYNLSLTYRKVNEMESIELIIIRVLQ